MSNISWEYIAGFIDGEGCFSLSKYDNSKWGTGSKGKRAAFIINQLTKNDKVLLEMSKFLTKNNIRHGFYRSKYKGCKNPMSFLRMGHRKHLRVLILNLLPFLIVKKKKVEKLLKFCEKYKEMRTWQNK